MLMMEKYVLVEHGLTPPHTVELEIPQFAQIRGIGIYGGRVWLYAQVDTKQPNEKRKFACRSTGYCCDGLEACPFIGTVLMFGGRLVLHVWELRNDGSRL